MRERWFSLSGGEARVADANFAQYLAETLSTLTLEGTLPAALERVAARFATLILGEGDATAIAAEVDVLRQQLIQARAADRIWQAARAMVSEGTNPIWARHHYGELRAFGIEQVPECAVVTFAQTRKPDLDSLEDVLCRDAFQRACVALGRRHGNIVCGQVGSQGVVFLVAQTGSARRVKSKLGDLADEAAALARRFGFRLHAGIGEVEGTAPLSARYRTAVAAAESALSRGERVVYGEPRAQRSAERLRVLRRELGAAVRDRPRLLSARFERYAEAALGHAGYRFESARAELAAGLERLAEPLLASGFLDQRAFGDLWSSVERETEGVATVKDLMLAYRRAVEAIETVVQNPTSSRRDRSVRQAQRFVREHLGDPLTIHQVARAAGFSSDHLWRVFKKREGVSLARYLRAQRLSRAKQMLKDSHLSIEQVQKLCGFRSRTTFHRVFKKTLGVTPLEYREASGLRSARIDVGSTSHKIDSGNY
jgi:AraC-like DNA-binding protein